MSESKTLAQMAAEARGQQPMQIAGKPADVCPYCGCALFVNRTETLATRTDRYEVCRNPNCRRRFLTRQDPPPPKRIVREIGVDEEISSAGKDALSVYRSAG